MRRETELFFAHLVREDRPVTELLTADYTFVNERLASHYGIPNVTGHRFRRVTATDENRRGPPDGAGRPAAAATFPESETEFFYEDTGARITFCLEDAGAATALTLHQGGSDLEMRRVERP